MNTHSSQLLKLSRNTFLKEPIDAFEIIVPGSKEKRKASSASKLRSKITHHSPSAPFQKEKSSSIIQKHIEKIVHGTFSNEKRNSEGNINKSKPRPHSGKMRKGVTYRNPGKNNTKVLEIKENFSCFKCKSSDFFKSPCSKCGNDSKRVNFSMEIKAIPHNPDKLQLIICKKEFVVNLSEAFEISAKITEKDDKKSSRIKSIELGSKHQWTFDTLSVTTPSFQGAGEVFADTSLRPGNFVNDFEISFAEKYEEWDEVYKKIEELNETLARYKDERKDVKLMEFSEKLAQALDEIASRADQQVKDCIDQVNKMLEIYFKYTANKSNVSLLHKKLDLRFASKTTASTGASANSSKF